jgi:hypothetical protein
VDKINKTHRDLAITLRTSCMTEELPEDPHMQQWSFQQEVILMLFS